MLIFRVLIDGKDYPNINLSEVSQESLTSQFEEESFRVTINFPNGIIYSLKIPKTREKYIPEKSKAHIKNNKLYISLYKGSETNWFTLKGMD